MPLVVAGGELEARSPEHAEARKINPRYARGDLVRVAVGRNLAEAELIKGMLLEHGIPSMLRRTGGFDVPDFLAAGPRDVLVPATGEAPARELLTEVEAGELVPAEATLLQGEDEEPAPRASGVLRTAAALLAVLLLFGALAGAVVVWFG